MNHKVTTIEGKIILDSFPEYIKILDSYTVWNCLKMIRIFNKIISNDRNIKKYLLYNSNILKWYDNNIKYYISKCIYRITNNKYIYSKVLKFKDLNLLKRR